MIGIIWVAAAFGVGAWASAWNRSFGGYTILSLILTPAIGVIILLVGGNNGKKCPQCAEFVKIESRKCKHCGAEFTLVEGVADSPAVNDEASNIW